MTKVEKFAAVILALGVLLTFIFWKDITRSKSIAGLSKIEKTSEDKGEAKSAKVELDDDSKEIKIVEKWEMPEELQEISGIAHMEGDLFACVQDEDGKIFVYNLVSKKIEKDIHFGDAGDYEGIAIVGETAYIVRSDGQLFEVKDFKRNKPTIVQHKTSLTGKQNVEGLSFDKSGNRLLLGIKGKEPRTDDYKGIYAFDLTTKQMATIPIVKIDLTDDFWNDTKRKNKINPSDLEVHPQSGEIYIVDGADPKLLVMANNGTKRNLYSLNDKDFPQPEGICITQAGDIFISNEGKRGPGNILKISIEK